ncbi:DUF4340 domain-containing protein [Kordiimonas gwangyangensis]|uniref:DUF4340 domain-containing protein n=1 Tax=Kordiimonas gwangyangensis TaxID=288022 RepID=UPI0003754FFE|nr:DUF4340 domain-containing protein [Kordiimonas gwangyangensis]
MSERLTNILGYLTLVAILAAIWVMFGEDPSREQGGRGEATFEGLSERINDAAGIAITQGKATTHLNRVGNDWFVIERDGYKADRMAVTDFLRGLALSERREPKTANEERFDKLGLGDGEALVIKVLDGDDRTLAEFLMGTRKDSPNGRSLTYIFQDHDTRAWLVSGLADTSAKPAWWLDNSVLDIAENRFARIAFPKVAIVRELGESKYTLEGLKDGEAAEADWQLRDPARVLSNLSADDVRRLANPITDPVATVTADTYDGLRLTATLYQFDGATWAQLKADYSSERAGEGKGGMLPDAPMDGEGEAASISERTHGWLFKLSDYDAKVLMRKRADFLKSGKTED